MPDRLALTDAPPRPVSIVTGFLGSGKTTLIGRVLRDPAFARTAVIVNEWGEIGLDHALIASSEESLLALTTGCLCCAVRSDLAATLLDLDRRAATGTIPDFTRVLIETSGLADPAPILATLLTDPDLARRCRVDTVVTVVDAGFGETALNRHPEARRQAALADRIVLSKTDLSAPPPGLLARLAALNPNTTPIAAIRGALAPALLFETADPEARAGRLAHLPEQASGDPFARGLHSDGINSFVLERTEPIPGAALTLLLEALVEHCGPQLLRLKGLVEVAEAPGRPVLIQGVRHALAAPEWLPNWPAGWQGGSALVFVTEGVPRHFPARLLAAIEAEVAEETARPGLSHGASALPA